MAKNKSVFLCGSCGYESSGWLGKCPSCQSWNTFTEEKIHVTSSKENMPSRQQISSNRKSWTGQVETVPLSEVKEEETSRFSSGIPELDRVLGGGFVSGSVILVGGDPGIGKSTLLLQAAHLTKTKGGVLYISGEESASQIRLRAERLTIHAPRITLSTYTEFEQIAALIEKDRPVLCIIDSIQTLYTQALSSAPGSVSQVREVTAGLVRLAKTCQCTLILVGHVTKDGAIAGPRVLEHMVDTVLYFESENTGMYRLIRAVKNRFGPAGELAFFEMTSLGLHQIPDTSSLLLAGRPLDVPGTAITASVQGTRSIFLEIQALTNPSSYSTPQRIAQGMDRTRLGMILAVMEKCFRVGLNNLDVYANVVGGIQIAETSCDLAVAAAVFSSLKNKAVRKDVLLLGEIGLTGEIRPVPDIGKRVGDIGRFGFTQCIIPGSNQTGLDRLLKEKKNEADFIFVDTLSEAMDILFSDR